MTPSANLIPPARLQARRVTAAIRAWLGVGAACLVLLAGAYVALLSALGHDTQGQNAELTRAATETASAQNDLKNARAELAGLTRRLAAAQDIRAHPDWSILLATLGSIRGDDVVLAAIDLTPALPPGAGPTTSRPSVYQLNLTGLARDHRAATAFSLAVERTALFSRVRLTDTTAQTVNRRDVVAFSIECTLQEPGSAAP